ncbi:NALCN channel auxiliary factor 2-like [Tachypleus tridentatus]|uniref:NALCN channel auxiliary factor 2-like n=1 Tax=Tachypleus tridentatus TaxID=6853 RepID=UPI003FD49FED
MKFVFNYETCTPNLEKPYREILQKWRLCLASLVFFAIVLVDNVAACHVNTVRSQFRNPWIPYDFMNDYTFNTEVIRTCHGPQEPRQSQCLHLEEDLCSLLPSTKREQRLGQLHLDFCSNYALKSVLDSQGWQYIKGDDVDHCRTTLHDVVSLDNIAKRVMCEVEDVLARYDCQAGFSVNFKCEDCEKVYREWICAMMVPFHVEDQFVKPCRSFCHRVERQCPYFHPFVFEQYAGEPVFFCTDPNVPDIPAITPDSPYGQPGSCYEPCHLSLDTGHSSCKVSDLLESLKTNYSVSTLNSSLKAQVMSSCSTISGSKFCVVSALLLFVVYVFSYFFLPIHCMVADDKTTEKKKNGFPYKRTHLAEQ